MIKSYKNKNHLKIIFITTSLGLGGAEKILYEILKEFKQSEILVISLGDKDFFSSNLYKLGIKVEYLNLKNNLSLIYKIFKLINILRKFRPKIIHTWLYKANIIGGIAAKLSGNKFIYWSIHHDLENEQKSFLRFLFMLISAVASQIIPKKIIFCSKSSAINHINFGFNSKRSIVINNGIDINKFKKDPSIYKEYRKNKFNLKNDTFLIGSIGRYHPIKDQKTLLKALLILKEKNINFKCILAGENLNKKNKYLYKQICELKLNNNIFLMGKIKNIKNILCSLDLLVISSLSECSPIVLLEAISSDLLCISTNVGGIKNIIQNKNLLFKKRDHEELAKKIIFFMNNRNKFEINLKESKNIVLTKYSLKKMVNEYRKIYNL